MAQFFADIKASAYIDFCNAILADFTAVKTFSVLKNRQILGVPAAAFTSNVERLANMAALPTALMDWSTRVQFATDGAMFTLTGTLFPKESQLPSLEAINTERNRLFNKNLTYASAVIKDADGRLSNIDPGYANANDLSALLSEHFAFGARTGMEALCSSLIVGAYTALECFASDAWIAAVNSRPRTLARYVLEPIASGRKRKDEVQPDASVPYKTLVDHDFNVSAVMGQVLADRKRASFDSFYDIRESYLTAFRIPQHPDLRPSTQLRNLFDSAERDVRTVEEVRNLIVHRGGVVDKKFYDNAVKTTIPQESLELSESLIMNCENSSKYAMAAISFTKSLLLFVDEWLTANPESATPIPTQGDSQREDG